MNGHDWEEMAQRLDGDVRALEAKLAEAEAAHLRAFSEVAKIAAIAEAAESRLSALRPLVRAAVLLHENEWGANDDWDALYDSTNGLAPALVAWAKGGDQ